MICSCIIKIQQSQLLGIHFFPHQQYSSQASLSYDLFCLHCKIPKNCTSLIFNDCFWLVLVPFCCHWYSFCSTDFPMDTSSNSIMSSLVLLLRKFATFTHNLNPIMSSLVLFLSKFATFTHNVVDCLISLSTHLIFHFFFPSNLFIATSSVS